MSPRPPCLLITGGDPCGIGPEVIVKALVRPLPSGVRWLVIGDQAVFERTAHRLKIKWPSRVSFLDCPHATKFQSGRTSAAAGQAALDYLNMAIQHCRLGLAHGIVTAPITKWAVQQAGHRFQGHTEHLAAAFNAHSVVMMFVSQRLRIVLLTRHVALRHVATQVRPSTIVETIRMAAYGLRTQFGLRHPRLAICGLNPHAGEQGAFGDEERRILAPALRMLRRQRLRIEGPFAADGFFAQPSTYDAVVCWYHDQGLIPFKMAARCAARGTSSVGRPAAADTSSPAGTEPARSPARRVPARLAARDHGCQVTLGLPIVRTSPDHGSALDLAGRGIANPGSMRYALEVATTLVMNREHREGRE